MNRFNTKKYFFLLLFLLLATAGFAQNISNLNLDEIDVRSLNDMQIQKIYKEAQARGLSPDDVAQLAIVRGMSRSEASLLRSRLEQASTGIQTDIGKIEVNRMRNMPDHKEQPASSDKFFNDDSVRSEKLKLKNKIFGYHFFSDKAVPFVPVLNIPTPVDYQLGAGDQVIIDIWGAAQQTYIKKISPEGTINIEKLGPIFLSGLTIDEARKRLKERLSSIYAGLTKEGRGGKDTYMQVSLGQIRSIQVTIIGEVAKPGSYTLPSLATIFNAVYAAGGPTVKGSFRSIELIRDGETIATLDLYDLFIKGDRSENTRLRSQDIIKINPYINRVHITGEVKRPAIYEMKDSETLADLIHFAGGFTGEAYTAHIRVVGNTDRLRKINDIPKKKFDDFHLRNGGVVTVQKILDRFKNLVQIQGAVFWEGKYELTDSTTVHSLIQKAGGLRGDAFSNRGIIYREQDDYTLKAISFDVKKVMSNEKYDVDLQKNDLVVISSIYDLRDKYYVRIEGAVNNADKFLFAEGMSLEDIILRAGGFTKAAIPYRIEVARRLTTTKEGYEPSQIAKIFHFSVSKNLGLDPQEASFELQPFDIVYVRRATNYEEQQEVIISGEVKYPGTYALQSNNARISDIINRAGGLTPDAYTNGATLYRKLEGLEYRTDKAEENREGFYTQLSDSLRRIQQNNIPDKVTISKIGIELPMILKDPGSKYDFLVQEGDSIYVPKQLQTVMVKGGVFYPTSIRFDERLSFMDYISSAGGFTEAAKKDNAYIIYANGGVDRVKEFLFFKNYPDVKPGATLVVPEENAVDKLTPGERVAIYSAIVSTLAVISTTIFQLTR